MAHVEVDLNVLGPIEVKTAAAQVFDRLVTAFALGLYPPGHRLPPERELATRLGVSRVTLRDALARLDELGYLESRRGRYGGTFVTSEWPAASTAVVRQTLAPLWDELEDLFDLFHQFLPVIGRLAAERRTADDLARLDDARERYERAPDREHARVGDRAFHAAVEAAAHNSILTTTARQLTARLTLGVDAFPYSEHIQKQAVREHHAILDAIDARDGDRAGRLLVEHFIELAEKPLRRLYERAGGPLPQQADAP